MFRLIGRRDSPWPLAANPPGALAGDGGSAVHVDVATGPLAMADLVALMVAARRTGGRPTVRRQWAGCRPAVAFDQPRGMPHPVASSVRADAWLQAVRDAACDRSATATGPETVVNRRLYPPVAMGWPDVPQPPGVRHLPPVVTVVLPRTRRSLDRLGANAWHVLDTLPGALVGGAPPVAPPGAALEQLATARGDAIHAASAREAAALENRIGTALTEWHAAHADAGLVAPPRIGGATKTAARQVAHQLARAATREAVTLRAHAVKAATQLAPFALPQEVSLSADWLADVCGGPSRLCRALCAVLDLDAGDHQVLALD